MKTMKKAAEVAFNAIEFKEALIVLPVMDFLVNNINMFLGSTYDPNGEDAKFGKELLAGFEVLKTLGFEHTVEFNDCVKERLSND